MKKQKSGKFFGTVSLFVVSLSLTACSNSEPSETEMFDAMKNTGMDLVKESERADFKKVACEKAGEKIYKCGATFKSATAPAMNYSFVKSDGKWQMSLN